MDHDNAADGGTPAEKEPSGLLLLDKPSGITSHDAVARARRWLHTRRVGHAGTLDPMATGLLTICVGQATRLVEYLTGHDKRYIAEMRLGIVTNTDDAEGAVVETRPVPEITAAHLGQIRARFSGSFSQIPPQYSAIKKDGVRSYARARQGESFELAARPVQVYALDVVLDPADAGLLHLEVHCGSGTYIRALARDIGVMLGCGGHLSKLRRTRVGALSVAEALTVSEAEELASHGELAQCLLPMDLALASAPSISLDLAGTKAVLMGRAVRLEAEASAPVCRVYGATGRFIAVGMVESSVLRPVKVLATEQDAASQNLR